MKYVRYTFVDTRTLIPVSEAPAKNGPTHPQGITPTFAIEATYESGTPAFYGIAEDDFVAEDWMYEMEEVQFYSDFRLELKERARKKRKVVEQGGVDFFGSIIETDIASQNRIANLVTTLKLDETILSIDFEGVPGSWVVVDRDSAFAMAKAVAQHVQDSFSWCKGLHEQIDNMVDFDAALKIVLAINAFGVKEPEVVV